MSELEEQVYGYKGCFINCTGAATCFTEIRLSQAERHACRYGLLGIGVTRSFVLDRLGGPVHYVRNHDVECVVGNIKFLLDDLTKRDAEMGLRALTVNSAFIKKMSDHGSDDFIYLDEHEWRIIHTFRQESKGTIIPTGKAQPSVVSPKLIAFICHCERKRSNLKSLLFNRLLRRFAPRNDLII